MAEETTGAPQAPDPQAAFATLGRMMRTEQTLQQTLQEVAELTRRVLPDVREVSMTLLDGERAWTAVFTGETALELDERQYEDGYGPCMAAAATGRSVLVTTGGDDAGYADFARASAAAGISHVLSVGLPVPRRVLGALNIYVRRPTPVAEAEIRLAETFAGFAAVAVGNAASHSSTVDLDSRLLEAVRSRTLVEEATSILMARHGHSASAAFDALRALAQEQGRPLLAVARSVVDGVGTH